MPLFYAKQTDYINKLNLIGSKNMKSTFTCSSTATKTLDLTAGHVFVLNVTGTSKVDTTIAFSNPPGNGIPIELTIYVVITDPTLLHTIIWPAEVYWSAGTVPPLTSTGANRVDIFRLFSPDGGTKYYAQGGANVDLNNFY